MGPLAGKTVDVKYYAKRGGVLDVNERHLPRYHLVLTGPKSAAMTSKARTRPFIVEEVFLFDAESLLAEQRARGVGIGVASSVLTRMGEAARCSRRRRNLLCNCQRSRSNFWTCSKT